MKFRTLAEYVEHVVHAPLAIGKVTQCLCHHEAWVNLIRSRSVPIPDRSLHLRIGNGRAPLVDLGVSKFQHLELHVGVPALVALNLGAEASGKVKRFSCGGLLPLLPEPLDREEARSDPLGQLVGGLAVASRGDGVTSDITR